MDIILRAAVIFALLFVVTRIIGRRELGEMEPFDFVILIVLGEIVQQGVNQDDLSLTGSALAVFTFAGLTVAMSYLSFRFRRLRPVLEGEPIVLVRDGRPIESNMSRERITIEDLQEQARLQQIRTLDEVEVAVLETGGQISFIPRRAG